MQNETTVQLADPFTFKQKAIVWANRFSVFMVFDSNSYTLDKYSKFDWRLVVDAIDFCAPTSNSFTAINDFFLQKKTAIYGFMGYDLQAETHSMSHLSPASVLFPKTYFFSPRYIFEINEQALTINRNYPETFEIIAEIEAVEIPMETSSTCIFKEQIVKAEYIDNVKQIQSQIAEGDYYEINYCTEVMAENCELNPLHVFFRLNERSQSPFSTLLKFQDKYCLCASPERFLAKRGAKIVSQPIKGTIPRGKNEIEDNLQKEKLLTSPKERAENVMIVDLVRNDLTPFSTTGSVVVEELFGIYTFNTLHQMISTIVANLENEKDFLKAMKMAYPMGSMTGAPKLAVMEKITQIEKTARGLFSGTMGYIEGSGDADFNVVIRALFYDKKSKIASIKTGSAITYDADPNAEYDELMLKRKAVLAAAKGRIE